MSFTMATNALVQARIDLALKEQAAGILAQSGLTVSDAVRLMLIGVVRENGLPFAVGRPNAQTRAAMAEADEMLRARRARFADGAGLLNDLDEKVGRE